MKDPLDPFPPRVHGLTPSSNTSLGRVEIVNPGAILCLFLLAVVEILRKVESP